jgi:hypothetical protein
MRGVGLAGGPAPLAGVGTDEHAGADRSVDRRVDPVGDGGLPAMDGTPADHGPSVRLGPVELARERLGSQARLAGGEAAVARADLPIEAVEWLVDPQRRQAFVAGAVVSQK